MSSIKKIKKLKARRVKKSKEPKIEVHFESGEFMRAEDIDDVMRLELSESERVLLGKYIMVEGDISDWLEAKASLLIDRYNRKKRTDFKTDEPKEDIKNKKIGLYGEYAFQTVLAQDKFWCIPSSPLFEFKEHRTMWDFLILKKDSGYLSVEVKTFSHDKNYLTVKKSLWYKELADKSNKPPDWVVALRKVDSDLMPEPLKELKKKYGKLREQKVRFFEFMGYIEGSKVAGLPHNSKICPYAECHCCKFEDLPYRDAKEFWDMLKKDCMRMDVQ